MYEVFKYVYVISGIICTTRALYKYPVSIIKLSKLYPDYSALQLDILWLLTVLVGSFTPVFNTILAIRASYRTFL